MAAKKTTGKTATKTRPTKKTPKTKAATKQTAKTKAREHNCDVEIGERCHA